MKVFILLWIIVNVIWTKCSHQQNNKNLIDHENEKNNTNNKRIWINNLKNIEYRNQQINRKHDAKTIKEEKETKTLLSNISINSKEQIKCPPLKTKFLDTGINLFYPRKLKTFFFDVLLIIHFSWPYFDNISFLKEIYESTFPNIVFYAHVKKEESPKEVIPIDTSHGRYQYRALSDAIIRYPGYRGYLFINDDVFIKYWKLNRLDKDKFWEPWNIKDPEKAKKENLKFVEYKSNIFENDRFWAFKFEKENLRLIYNCINKKYLNMLEQSTGNRKIWVGQTADFIYVPGKFAKEFAILANWFYDIGVRFAITISNIIRMLDKQENFDKVYAVYLWGTERERWKNYIIKEEVEFVHPLKLSNQNTRKFIRNIINKI